jgi:prophage antirepressor-like protein
MQINQKSDATGIQVFNSTMFGEIRTIIKDDGECFFVASDVAKALGYAVPQKAVLDHCKHCSKMEHPYNKGTYMNIIPESDMYRLTMKSKLPNAELFQDWVCEEVIPAIRKTGGYIATHQDDTPEEIMARALTIAQATLSKREERLKQLEAQTEQQQATIKIQTEEIKQAAPKNRFSFGNLRNCCIFAVLTVRQTLLLRRAAVNCSMVIGHFLCSIFKDIRRLSIRSHYCFVLRSKVCWTVSSVYGNRFSVAYNDLNAYSHGK